MCGSVKVTLGVFRAVCSWQSAKGSRLSGQQVHPVPGTEAQPVPIPDQPMAEVPRICARKSALDAQALALYEAHQRAARCLVSMGSALHVC